MHNQGGNFMKGTVFFSSLTVIASIALSVPAFGADDAEAKRQQKLEQLKKARETARQGGKAVADQKPADTKPPADQSKDKTKDAAKDTKTDAKDTKTDAKATDKKGTKTDAKATDKKDDK